MQYFIMICKIRNTINRQQSFWILLKLFLYQIFSGYAIFHLIQQFGYSRMDKNHYEKRFIFSFTRIALRDEKKCHA